MTLKEALKLIMENAEKTLDAMTGETPESRKEAKEKFKKFINELLNKKENIEDKKNNENNS